MMFWQMAALAVPGLAGLGLSILMTRRLLGYRRPAAGQESSENTSLDISLRYQPMARLLDPAELHFLMSQPGYRPHMGARLKKSRRRIFRRYLSELTADFQRLHRSARRIAAEAPEEHAHLIPFLMRQQVAFWRAIAVIELRLALSWAGMAPGDAQGLLDLVTKLQQALAAAPQPA